ncbi:nuclear transport factor 2 family protein [Kribbella sindirgiensis]|uniref:Nuclear transport factor 2 family protein n=1 Tax=Kribbella sindirgiensis TaxID=1124744 RepID=A0A4R0I7D3_9ACTN|nr:nuclear transport factor 2 family protein [Kribbella sindirgiensis]TCC26182.1 nuclear transport factor 2 family protein [Kribbella sindirgiensis]
MLPDTITKYLISHVTRNVPAAMRWYADDAEVTNDGKTYRGRDEIRAWLASAASEYSYTTELTGTRQVDEQTYVATHHLEGNFPGGTADLDFTFTLTDGSITRLVIS